jgi:hypothetical protein
MQSNQFKTPLKIEREKRDLRLYEDYMRFLSVPGAMKTLVAKKIMAKYKIYSYSTVWAIVKRVGKLKETQ